MKKQLVKFFCFTFLLVSIIELSTSCTFFEYKTYTLKKDDIHFRLGGIVTEHPRFSLEYPSSFKLVDLSKLDELTGFTGNITAFQFRRKESGKIEDLYVSIFKSEPEKYYTESLVTLIYVLDYALEKNILAEKNIDVAGVQGTYYLCQPNSDDKDNIYFIAYFEHSGFKWTICLLTYKGLVDQVEKEFDRIIGSFKILN